MANDAQLHFERGHEAMERGEYRDAVEAFTKAIAAMPTVAAGYRARSQAYRALKDRPRTIADLTEAIRLNPGDAQLRAERAYEHLQQRSDASAIEDCDAAMRLDSGRTDVYGMRAVAHGRSGNTPMAMLDFEVALRCDPDNAPKYLCGRARLHLELEQYDAVVRDTTTALALDESHSPAIELRAMAYAKQKNYAAGEADFRSLRDREPRNPMALLGLGLMLSEQKRWADCRDAADEIIAKMPTMANGYELRGMCHENLGDYPAAIADFERSIAMNPRSTLGLQLRAGVFLKQGEWAKAIADHQKAFTVDPDDNDAINHLAWVRATVPIDVMRDGPLAVELATRACEQTDFQNAGTLDTLAASYANVGDFDKAVAFAEKAVSLAMGDVDRTAFSERLELFRQKQPYRLAPKPPHA
jgi:serine/threonine-protein kinase